MRYILPVLALLAVPAFAQSAPQKDYVATAALRAVVTQEQMLERINQLEEAAKHCQPPAPAVAPPS